MKHHIVIAALLLVAAPMAVAADGPAEESDWGRCQAYYASEEGNDSSNGSAHDNPGFEGIDSNCDEETSPPYEDTPAEDHAGDNPGQDGADNAPDDPGSDEGDDNQDNGDDNREDGEDNVPDDPGSQQPSLFLP